jgi:type VI secretion system protein VasD
LSIIVDHKGLNPGPDGQPLPTVVRVYQLKGTSKLETVSLDELVRNEKDALGDDVVDVVEITLNAHGDRVFPEMRRRPLVTHVAVAALFRKPSATSWRALAVLPPVDSFHCHRALEKRRWIQFFLHDYSAEYVPAR